MKTVIALVTAVSLLSLAACEKKNTPPANPAPATTGSAAPTVPGTTGTAPALPDAGGMLADAKNKMVSGIESGLASAKTKLDEWTAKASTAADDKKPEMQAALDKLKGSYSELTKNLSELKSKAGTEWDKAFDNVKASWNSMETSMNEFATKYKP